jgi:uncharacterized membrane protein
MTTAKSALSKLLPGLEGGKKTVSSVTVNRAAGELFEFWRNLENLPRFMKHLESVKLLDDKRSHWVANSPTGGKLEWDAEIINQHPNELIAWRSCEGADVQHAGTVRFEPAPGGRGTEVTVRLECVPTAGVLGRAISKLFGADPALQIEEDLRRFKAVMETGEVPTTEGQPRGPQT